MAEEQKFRSMLDDEVLVKFRRMHWKESNLLFDDEKARTEFFGPDVHPEAAKALICFKHANIRDDYGNLHGCLYSATDEQLQEVAKIEGYKEKIKKLYEMSIA